MDKPKIILVGGGGHCKSCIEVIEAENRFEIEGIIDLATENDKSVLNYPVIGEDSDLLRFIEQGYFFLITIGHLGQSKRRQEIFDLLIANGGKLPIIKSPSSFVSRTATIGKGTIIMHNAIVNSDASIGTNSIINNNALVEHDCTIGNDCHVSTGVLINGNCRVLNNVFIGSASTLKNGVELCDNIRIGAGSLIVKSIKEEGLYFGSPVKKMNL